VLAVDSEGAVAAVVSVGADVTLSPVLRVDSGDPVEISEVGDITVVESVTPMDAVVCSDDGCDDTETVEARRLVVADSVTKLMEEAV